MQPGGSVISSTTSNGQMKGRDLGLRREVVKQLACRTRFPAAWARCETSANWSLGATRRELRRLAGLFFKGEYRVVLVSYNARQQRVTLHCMSVATPTRA